MLDNVQGTQNSSGSQWTEPQPLTSDQKAQVQSILSGYDSTNLSAGDAKAILQSLRQAGIGPSPDLRNTINGDGFNLQQIVQLARPQDAPGAQATTSSQGTQGTQGHHHHHHHHGGASGAQTTAAPSDQTLNTDTLQSLKSILSQYDLNNLSSDQQTSLLKQLDSAGLLQSGYSVDLSA